MTRRYRRRGGWGFGDWTPYYEPTQRRETKNGIRAKSQRGAIGETWWSQRFIELLESFDIGARLSRGRSYARSGQVMDLEIRAGEVTSRVQGSREAPYRVRIALAPLTGRDWARVEHALADQALFAARLLAGEMPHDIEEVFGACAVSLFPRSTEELRTACSCPDWSNPCKHIAATYYILAERFDEDPFSILAWRGRDRDELLASLRKLRRSAVEAVPPERAPRARRRREVAPLAPPLEAELDHFWEAGTALAELRVKPQAAAIPDALLRQLGPLPAELAGGVELVEELQPLYAAMARGAAERALGASS